MSLRATDEPFGSEPDESLMVERLKAELLADNVGADDDNVGFHFGSSTFFCKISRGPQMIAIFFSMTWV